LEEQFRQPDEPVAIQNVGNSCYVSSLLQFYYSLPQFVQIIFGFKNVIQVDGKRELEAKLIESGAKIICELQRAFAFMAMGVKGYYKPTQLLDVILDDTGTSLEQGQ
jgi:ubiquitin C-terminal hydrolase